MEAQKSINQNFQADPSINLTPTKINQKPKFMVLTLFTTCNRQCVFCEVEKSEIS